MNKQIQLVVDTACDTNSFGSINNLRVNSYRKHATLAVGIVLVASLYGCQSNSELEPPVQQIVSTQPSQSEQPQIESIENPVVFPVGTIFTWKGRGNRFNKKYVIAVESTTETVRGIAGITYANKSRNSKSFFTYEGNRVQSWNEKGELRQTYTPPRQYLQFPLAPGSSWTAHWRYKNHIRKNGSSTTANIEVVGWENVKTPLGNLRTMKLVAKGIKGAKFTRKIWYSPQYGVVQIHYSDRRTGQKNVLQSVV